MIASKRVLTGETVFVKVVRLAFGSTISNEKYRVDDRVRAFSGYFHPASVLTNRAAIALLPVMCW